MGLRSIPRPAGAPPVTAGGVPIDANSSPPFPSTTQPPNWYTVPSYNSPIMNPDTNTLGIPWYNFLTFASSRAATITGIQGDVSTLQNNVTTLQGQVTTIQGQIAALQTLTNTHTSQIATLQSQVATIQGQISTIQGQITALQATDANLQNQINVIDAIFAVHTVAGLPTPAGNQGRKTNVSDALGPAFGVAVVGGGAVFSPVYCDGTTWFVG